MMENLKGMVLLYTETCNRGKHTYQCVFDSRDFDKAWEKALEFVGEHSPVDGCSTEPRKWKSGETYGIARGTSFGDRMATVARVPHFGGW